MVANEAIEAGRGTREGVGKPVARIGSAAISLSATNDDVDDVGVVSRDMSRARADCIAMSQSAGTFSANDELGGGGMTSSSDEPVIAGFMNGAGGRFPGVTCGSRNAGGGTADLVWMATPGTGG